MDKSAKKRLYKEFQNILAEPLENCSAKPKGSNLFDWDVTLVGPKGSPYEGGVFKISIKVPFDYPFKPTKVQFLTKVFHTNINAEGNVCMDILGVRWSPALTISKLILSIVSLLSDSSPETDSKARQWTRECALP